MNFKTDNRSLLIATGLAKNPLGADNGLGFGWKDQNVVKLGGEWVQSQALTLRAGYSHASKTFDGS